MLKAGSSGCGGSMSYALLSVSNKEGITPLASALVENGYKLISSGGTHKVISEADIPVMKVSEYTGSPEILGGRVKTLHPKIHGGILAKRGDPNHAIDMKSNGIEPIDIVAVNLYPFKETIAKPDVTWDKAIENIELGQDFLNLNDLSSRSREGHILCLKRAILIR